MAKRAKKDKYERVARAVTRALLEDREAALVRAFEEKKPTRQSGRKYTQLLESCDALRRNLKGGKT